MVDTCKPNFGTIPRSQANLGKLDCLVHRSAASRSRTASAHNDHRYPFVRRENSLSYTRKRSMPSEQILLPGLGRIRSREAAHMAEQRLPPEYVSWPPSSWIRARLITCIQRLHGRISYSDRHRNTTIVPDQQEKHINIQATHSEDARRVMY
jgi:hypothetical protein